MKDAALRKTLEGLEVGKSLDLPPLLPAVSEQPTQAFLVSREGDYWTFDLYWHGVRCGRTTAQVLDGKLILEVL